MKVFVYGTLKRDEGNHRLMRGGEFVGEAVTVDAYRMVDLGSFPGVVDPAISTADKTPVHGELYDVGDVVALDRLEGHPTFYRRQQAAVRCNGRTVDCWLYFLQQDHRMPVTGGNWPGRIRETTT